MLMEGEQLEMFPLQFRRQDELAKMMQCAPLFVFASAGIMEIRGKAYMMESMKKILYSESDVVTERMFETELEKVVDECIDKLHIETMEARVENLIPQVVEGLKARQVSARASPASKEERRECLARIWEVLGTPTHDELVCLLDGIEDEEYRNEVFRYWSEE